jgi:hypothetical protein
MTYMQSWKSLGLTSHTWLGLNPQIGRPLSRIVVPLVYFVYFLYFWSNFSPEKYRSTSNFDRHTKISNLQYRCVGEVDPNLKKPNIQKRFLMKFRTIIVYYIFDFRKNFKIGRP